MSLDYPDYEELQKKSKFLCVVWRIGDMGCYLGLFGMIGAPFLVISDHFNNRRNQVSWDKVLLLALSAAGIFLCILVGAASLKYFAVKLGKRLKRKY